MEWREAYLSLGQNSVHVLIAPEIAGKFKDPTFVQYFGNILTGIDIPEGTTLKIVKTTSETGEDSIGVIWDDAVDNLPDLDNDLKSPPKKKSLTEDEMCSGMSSLSPFKSTPNPTGEGIRSRKSLFGDLKSNINEADEFHALPLDSIAYEDLASGFAGSHDSVDLAPSDHDQDRNFENVAPRSLYAETGDGGDPAFANAANYSQKPVEGTFALSSEEGTRRFLVACIKTRESFKPNTKHAAAYVRLQADLEEQQVYAAIADLKKKRKSLHDQYSKKKSAGCTGWAYYAPCAVLFGDRDLATLIGSKYESIKCSEEPPHPSIVDYDDIVFPKVAQWNNASTFALIEAYDNVKEEFDKPRRHSFLWNGISKSLFEKDNLFRYSPQQCESKWNTLAKKYKDCVDELEGSGASRADAALIAWPFFAAMGNATTGDVSVRPAYTVAAGSTFEMKKNPGKNRTSKATVEEGKGDSPPEQRRGKSRPPSMKKKTGENKSPNDALARIAKAMEKRNRLMEKSLQAKGSGN